MGLKYDIKGQVFGELTAICHVGGGNWMCSCSCGRTKIVYGNSLRSGKTMSCGCRTQEFKGNAKATHHESKTRLHRIWTGIRTRCNNKNCRGYRYYGARGISVCEEWNDFSAFREWAISHGYNDNLTIDRIDVNGNYCPENCRWVTMDAQKDNKRTSVYIKYNGETKTAAEWGRTLGMSGKLIRGRKRKGWSDIECIEGRKNK